MPMFQTYRKSDITRGGLKWYRRGYAKAKGGGVADYDDAYEIVARYADYPEPGGRRVEAKEYFLAGFTDGWQDNRTRINPKGVIPKQWTTAKVRVNAKGQVQVAITPKHTNPSKRRSLKEIDKRVRRSGLTLRDQMTRSLLRGIHGRGGPKHGTRSRTRYRNPVYRGGKLSTYYRLESSMGGYVETAATAADAKKKANKIADQYGYQVRVFKAQRNALRETAGTLYYTAKPLR